MERPVDIAALVRTADAAEGDAGALRSLVHRSWFRTSDATSRAGRDWVSRWRPARLTAEPPDCVCTVGRCGWCN